MGKTTIKIEDSEARKLYKSADSGVRTLLEQSFPSGFFSNKIQDRINDFDDILEELGKTMEEIIPWKNPRTKAQKSQNAFAKLQCIAEVYNEGVEMDFTNSNQYKYYNWWNKSSGGWSLSSVVSDDSSASCGFGVYFKSRELAEDATTKFKSIYLDYLP